MPQRVETALRERFAPDPAVREQLAQLSVDDVTADGGAWLARAHRYLGRKGGCCLAYHGERDPVIFAVTGCR